jgi:steroid delta-isomerase-like uncharacterized protein
MAELTEQAKTIVKAFNDADWEAIRSLIGDSTYNELGTGRSLSGADEIIEALQGWKAAMPDANGTVTSATESDERVVLEIMWEGTQTGDMVTDQGTIPASGRHQSTPGAFVFDFDGGRLVESRNYFDLLTFLRQIGAA